MSLRAPYAEVRERMTPDAIAICDDAMRHLSRAEAWKSSMVQDALDDESASRHAVWLARKSVEPQPEADLYWKRRPNQRRSAGWRRAEKVAQRPGRIRETLSAQLGSLQHHGYSQTLTALVVEARDAVDSLPDTMPTGSAVPLVVARQRLGWCLGLGWPTQRTRSALVALIAGSRKAER